MRCRVYMQIPEFIIYKSPQGLNIGEIVSV